MKKKKNALKENPLMADKKNKKIKVNGVVSDEENEVKRFIIIVLVIGVIIGLIYGLTELLNKKNDDSVEVVDGKVNYDRVSVGTLLNRPYDEYYVMVYDSKSNEAVKYSALITTYKGKEDDEPLKIYFCDLNNSLNSKYYNVNNDNKSNKHAQKIEDFDFGDLTLLHIKKGKITEYIEDYKTIQEKLK